MRGAVVVAVAVAACGPAGERPAGEAAPPPAVGDGALTGATPDAADAADAVFRALAEAVARRTGRVVAGWGRAPLAEPGASPTRFATLLPEDGRGRGAYLLEAPPAGTWLVGFYVDGRTTAWGVGAAADVPAWCAVGDAAVEHAQGHPRGGESVALALRGGRVVVLAHELAGDAELGEPGVRERFAVDGACRPACPEAAGFATEDLALEVAGPATSAAALVERRR